MDNQMYTLANGLQHSNIPEVKKLAQSWLALKIAYDELQHAHVKLTAEQIMIKHKSLFERLKESGD
jgi:hypothetical protein